MLPIIQKKTFVLYLLQWVLTCRSLDFSRLILNRMVLWKEWCCSLTWLMTPILKELLPLVLLLQLQNILHTKNNYTFWQLWLIWVPMLIPSELSQLPENKCPVEDLILVIFIQIYQPSIKELVEYKVKTDQLHKFQFFLCP